MRGTSHPVTRKSGKALALLPLAAAGAWIAWSHLGLNRAGPLPRPCRGGAPPCARAPAG